MRVPVHSIIDLSINRQIQLEKERPMLPMMGYQIWIRELRTTCLNFGRQAGHTTGAVEYLRLHDDAVLLVPKQSMAVCAQHGVHPEIARRIITFDDFLRRFGVNWSQGHAPMPIINTVIFDESDFRRFTDQNDKQDMKDEFYLCCERLGVMHVVLLGSIW